MRKDTWFGQLLTTNTSRISPIRSGARVVSNTDYDDESDDTRWARYDYSVEMVEGATGTADEQPSGS